MRRVAVLSDIHGNLPALEAVLEEVRAAAVDLIVLNGDLADGPFPAGTMDALMALPEPVLWLRGNSDRWLCEEADGVLEHDDPETSNLIAWACEQLAVQHMQQLWKSRLSDIAVVDGIGRVGFCHATARSDEEMFLVDSSFDHAAEAFAKLDTEIVIVGHSHMPFDRLFDRRRIVNAGSVGIPYGHTGASWALIGPDIVLRRTNYDPQAASERIERSGMPGAAAFASANVRSVESDRQAHAAFSEIVRRQRSARG